MRKRSRQQYIGINEHWFKIARQYGTNWVIVSPRCVVCGRTRAITATGECVLRDV